MKGEWLQHSTHLVPRPFHASRVLSASVCVRVARGQGNNLLRVLLHERRELLSILHRAPESRFRVSDPGFGGRGNKVKDNADRNTVHSPASSSVCRGGDLLGVVDGAGTNDNDKAVVIALEHRRAGRARSEDLHGMIITTPRTASTSPSQSLHCVQSGHADSTLQGD